MFKIYNESKKAERFLRLVEFRDGDIILEVVDAEGTWKGAILALTTNGKLELYNNIPSDLGFCRDVKGRIVVLGEDDV